MKKNCFVLLLLLMIVVFFNACHSRTSEKTGTKNELLSNDGTMQYDQADTTRQTHCGIDSVLSLIEDKRVMPKKVTLSRLYFSDTYLSVRLNKKNYKISKPQKSSDETTEFAINFWFNPDLRGDSIDVYEIKYLSKNYLLLEAGFAYPNGLASEFAYFIIFDTDTQIAFYTMNIAYRENECFFIDQENNRHYLGMIRFDFNEKYALNGEPSFDVYYHRFTETRDTITKHCITVFYGK